MSGTRGVGSAGHRWQRWAGAIGLAVLAAAAAQLLIHGLFMDAEMVQHHLVSGLIQAVIVLAPVIMYLGWRRAAEREAETSRRLRASEALRKDLVNMLIHDLTGPAVTTGMALNALARSETANTARTVEDLELLQIARDGVSRLEHMIGDMLDVAAAEAGGLRLNVSRVDLAALARAAVQETALRAEEGRIDVRGPSSAEAVPVEADAQRLRRVIDNLLANAVRFTPAHGSIDVSVASSAGEAVVTVRDSGPGVPHEQRERIFDTYGQAGTASGGRMSVGLGLAFCKLVVEAHGGRIWVETAPGQGSAFSFVLPLKDSAVER